MTTFDLFAHRQNRDASIDSICKTCYQTVASADMEYKLIEVERNHTCDPYGDFMCAGASPSWSASK